MKKNPILRTFCSVIPFFGMSFLLLPCTTSACVNSTDANSVNYANIEKKYEPSDFEDDVPVQEEDELSVTILSSTSTPTSHAFSFMFQTGYSLFGTYDYTMGCDNEEFLTYYNETVEAYESNSQGLTDLGNKFLEVENAYKNGEISEEEYLANRAPRYDGGYLYSFKRTEKEMTVPREFHRGNWVYVNVSTISRGAIVTPGKIEVINIPDNILYVAEDSFLGVKEGTVFNVEHTEKPDGWDDNWLPAGCTVNYGFNYDEEVQARKVSPGFTGTEPISNPDKNYILGYVPKEGQAYPLIVEYEYLEEPGVKQYYEFKVNSTSSNYNGVGKKLTGEQTTLSCVIPVPEDREINTHSIVLRNIYKSLKEDDKPAVPDLSQPALYIEPEIGFPETYFLTNFLNKEFVRVSTFADYIGVEVDFDFAERYGLYESIKRNSYLAYKKQIDAGSTIVRTRLTSLNDSDYIIRYTVDGQLVEKIIDFKTPIASRSFDKDENNNVVYLLNYSEIGDDFDPNNLVSVEIHNFNITFDLFVVETNTTLPRTTSSTKFGNVEIYNSRDSKLNLFNIDIFLIILTIAYVVIYASASVIYYFYYKNKHRNDEFRRMKTKEFIRNALLGFVGGGIVLFALTFIVLRWSVLNNTVVVFNPADPFIIVFGILSVLVIGYFVKFLVTRIKQEKERKTTIKLQLDKDVLEDGTN